MFLDGPNSLCGWWRWVSCYPACPAQKSRGRLTGSSSQSTGPAETLLNYAAIQIFVTVGTHEKREYLHKTFGIAQDHISNSRTSDFAREIRQRTDGHGVKVILNSLTGELLDESWKLLADGGILVEIGKSDIVQRNRLAMEPFDRNSTFRALDLSYVKEITDELAEK